MVRKKKPSANAFLLRMPRPLIDILKDEAQQRSDRSARRVTVHSIVMSALMSHDRIVRNRWMALRNERQEGDGLI